ncbi:DUF262 domain-containing protein [Plantactinospora sp. WMMB782]|uniref:DUF262 domain-containing protein n=1 Tax=Plantactinospora sp. WMMB782 TaxID=3404121 RepID=UPI003B95083B
MRFQTSDPDIATIFRRIERKTIDLQPDFQRGEVWSTTKKQRLIDTILRRWHVPPIHLVAKGEGKFDVLDGQQRLTAIRDFMQGLFTVDGFIEPVVPDFAELDGLRFAQLPTGVQDELESFAIRVFELHDYTPEEPHELFFRLNQPMTLTEAEKRNAFVGAARNQVKDLVEWAGTKGMTAQRLGFSNARMAYDDLLARFLLTLEQGRLTEKVTALRITTRYREKDPFSTPIVSLATQALDYFLNLDLLNHTERRLKWNKATVHTWLCLAAKLIKEDLLFELGPAPSQTIDQVESWRGARLHGRSVYNVPLAVFHDRATARVADVSSVVLRDLTAWMVLYRAEPGLSGRRPFLAPLEDAWRIINRTGDDADRELASFSVAARWGDSGWF